MPGLRSVRGRIILAFSLLMLLLAGISAVSFFRFQSDQVDIDALQRAALTAAVLDDIDIEFSLQGEALRAFPVTRDWSFADAFRDSVARVKQDIAEAQALQLDSGDAQLLAALDDIAGQVQEIAVQGEGVFLFTEVADAEQATAARAQIEASFASLQPVLDQLVSEQRRQMDAEPTAGEADLLLWALMGLAALVFLAGVLSARALLRSILRPLAALQVSARSIAKGEVRTTAQVSGPTEFESLAKDFNRMIVALLAKEAADSGVAEADARFRQLAERAADLVFRVDIHRGLTYANPAWEKVTGFTLEELASGPEIVGRLVHPDQWHSFVALWKGMLYGNIPEGPLPMKCLRKDGQAMWLVFTFVPVHDQEGQLVAIEGMARDATLLRHLVKEVHRRDDQLRLFLNLSNAAATAIEFEEVADRALEAVLELLPRADAGFLMAYNRNRDLLELGAVRGLDRKVISKLVAKPGEGLIGEVFQSGETQLYCSIEELTAAGGLGPEGEDLFKQATGESGPPQSILCAPLGIGERPFGCLVLVTFSQGSSFQTSDLDLLQAATTQVAVPLENARLRAETELRAITDGLTGLYNRAYFHQRLGEEIERAKRYEHGFAVMIADLDNFKSYNDAQGHAAGDEVLRLAADSVRSLMRRSDIACRYSGDEFAAIVMHADSTRAQTVVDRIAKSLASKLKKLNDPAAADLSLSAGIACYPDDATTVDDLLRLADVSLYGAKLSDSRAAQTA